MWIKYGTKLSSYNNEAGVPNCLEWNCSGCGWLVHEWTNGVPIPMKRISFQVIHNTKSTAVTGLDSCLKGRPSLELSFLLELELNNTDAGLNII